MPVRTSRTQNHPMTTMTNSTVFFGLANDSAYIPPKIRKIDASKEKIRKIDASKEMSCVIITSHYFHLDNSNVRRIIKCSFRHVKWIIYM